MMLKKHWPVLFAVFAVIVSIVLDVLAYHSTDTGNAIFAGVITFLFLFPLAGALIGAWYGWRLPQPKKWLIPFAVYVCVILYMVMIGLIFRADMFDVESCLTLGVFPALVCLGAEIVAGMIAWAVKRMRKNG